jgi:hypothetical protein
MIRKENFPDHALAKSRFLSRLSMLLSMTAAESALISAVAPVGSLSQKNFAQTFSATLKF